MTERSEALTVALALLLFAAVTLAFTLVSLYVSPVQSRTGTFRSLGEIPNHIALLVVGGAAIGILPSLVFRRLNRSLFVAIPSFVVLLDLDHLPSALGLAQTVRPAHSFIFVIVIFILMATIIKRPDLSFATMSGFFAHIAIDTGVFAPWSPLSFDYQSLAGYRYDFAAMAVVGAIAAGYVAKRRSSEARTR